MGLVFWSCGVRNVSIFTIKIRSFAAIPDHFSAPLSQIVTVAFSNCTRGSSQVNTCLNIFIILSRCFQRLNYCHQLWYPSDLISKYREKFAIFTIFWLSSITSIWCRGYESMELLLFSLYTSSLRRQGQLYLFMRT